MVKYKTKSSGNGDWYANLFGSLSDEFEWVETYYTCPECGQTLTNPVPSAMLVCSKSHGPYFLV